MLPDERVVVHVFQDFRKNVAFGEQGQLFHRVADVCIQPQVAAVFLCYRHEQNSPATAPEPFFHVQLIFRAVSDLTGLL